MRIKWSVISHPCCVCISVTVARTLCRTLSLSQGYTCNFILYYFVSNCFFCPQVPYFALSYDVGKLGLFQRLMVLIKVLKCCSRHPRHWNKLKINAQNLSNWLKGFSCTMREKFITGTKTTRTQSNPYSLPWKLWRIC